MESLLSMKGARFDFSSPFWNLHRSFLGRMQESALKGSERGARSILRIILLGYIPLCSHASHTDPLSLSSLFYITVFFRDILISFLYYSWEGKEFSIHHSLVFILVVGWLAGFGCSFSFFSRCIYSPTSTFFILYLIHTFFPNLFFNTCHYERTHILSLHPFLALLTTVRLEWWCLLINQSINQSKIYSKASFLVIIRFPYPHKTHPCPGTRSCARSIKTSLYVQVSSQLTIKPGAN